MLLISKSHQGESDTEAHVLKTEDTGPVQKPLGDAAGPRLPAFWGCRYESFALNVGTAAAKSIQSCPTLCDPRDGSPPGSLVPGILQARTLEWVAISFSNA